MIDLPDHVSKVVVLNLFELLVLFGLDRPLCADLGLDLFDVVVLLVQFAEEFIHF